MSNYLRTSLNLPSDRVLLGTTALWNAEAKWHDRDGLPIPPGPKLVIGMRIILRRWVDREAIDIIEHPLPDVDALNAAIPKPWPTGLAGQESPPWARHYVVYLCDPQTGSLYTFCNKTVGAKIAYEMLEEQIVVMRGLRGANLVPVVHLGQRQMKTKDFGMKSRPHFEVVEWKVLGGDGGDSARLPPQLSGPTGASAPAPNPAPREAPASASPPSPPAPETKAATTLDQMASAKPVTLGEIISDELPPWA